MAKKGWIWVFVGIFYDRLDRMVAACYICYIKMFERYSKNAYGSRDAEINVLRQRLVDEGIIVSSFHLLFLATDDIASFYEMVRRAAIIHMIQWTKVAGQLGACMGLQHLTINRNSAQENDLKYYFAQLYRSLEEILPAAREASVVIEPENMKTDESGGGRFFSVPACSSRLIRELDKLVHRVLVV